MRKHSWAWQGVKMHIQIHCHDKEKEWTVGHSTTFSEDQTWWGAQPCYSCHGWLDLQVHHITFQHHLSHLSCHRITIHIVCTLHAYTHIHMYTSIKLQCWIHDSAPDYHLQGFVCFKCKGQGDGLCPINAKVLKNVSPQAFITTVANSECHPRSG